MLLHLQGYTYHSYLFINIYYVNYLKCIIVIFRYTFQNRLAIQINRVVYLSYKQKNKPTLN